MENNNEQIFHEEPVVLHEKDESSSSWIWYLILFLLLIGLLAWFGFIKGWFPWINKNNPEINNKNNQVNEFVDVNNNPLLDENILQTNAPIDVIDINTIESFPIQKQLIVKGNLSNGCTYLNEPDIIRSGNSFYVNLTTHREGEACTQALVPYERVIDLDVLGLPAGVYMVSVNGRETQFEIEQDNNLDFSAGAEK